MGPRLVVRRARQLVSRGERPNRAADGIGARVPRLSSGPATRAYQVLTRTRRATTRRRSPRANEGNRPSSDVGGRLDKEREVRVASWT
jgi:hypothetical protein